MPGEVPPDLVFDQPVGCQVGIRNQGVIRFLSGENLWSKVVHEQGACLAGQVNGEREGTPCGEYNMFAPGVTNGNRQIPTFLYLSPRRGPNPNLRRSGIQ
jgi:hypothetical protein